MGFFQKPDGSEDTEKVQQLLDLVAGNEHSFTDIARVMGAPSRNVVLCKFNRLREKNSTLVHPSAANGSNQRVAKPRVARDALPPAVKKFDEISATVEPIELEDGSPITVLNIVSSQMCSFPIGDPASEKFRFCGHAKLQISEKVSSPYCPTHHKLCYIPAPRRTKGHVGRQH